MLVGTAKFLGRKLTVIGPKSVWTSDDVGLSDEITIVHAGGGLYLKTKPKVGVFCPFTVNMVILLLDNSHQTCQYCVV